MTATLDPTLDIHPLTRADGSATLTIPDPFTSASSSTTPSSGAASATTITAAVHGPLEASRRDELPEEAALDVQVRPAHGVAGPRERWLEALLAALLARCVAVDAFPRHVVRVALQLVGQTAVPPSVAAVAGAALARALLLLSGLVDVAFAALVDAAVPLRVSFVAAAAVVAANGEVVVLRPGAVAVERVRGCRSLHVMAFAQGGELLLDESVGAFGPGEWEAVVDALQGECVAALAAKGPDEGMGVEEEPWMRLAIEEKVRKAGAWRAPG